MISRRLSTAFALLLLSALAVPAADDPYGDPIPAGAKARLGTARLRATGGANFNAVTPDGKFLVGTRFDAGLVFIDPATGKEARTVKIDGEFGTVRGFSAGGKWAVGTNFGSATVVDADTGKKLVQVKRPLPGVDSGVSISADGKRLAVGGLRSSDPKDKGKDKAITAVVWDVDADKELAAVAPAQNESAHVNLSADGKRLVTWGYHYDRTAKEAPKPENDPSRLMQVWDAGTGKEVAKARMLAGYGILAVALSPDGSVLAASGGDGSVRLFDASSGAEKGQLLGRTRQGQKLAFSPDGKTIAAGGADGSVQRWSVADGARLSTTEAPFPITSGPPAVVFTGNDRAVAWTYRGATLALWEVPAGKLLTPAGGHFGGVVSAAVAGGGKEVLTAASDGVVMRWDPATGRELGSIPLRIPGGGFGSGVVNGPVTLSADGTRALGLDSSGSLGVFDLPAGTQQFAIPGDGNREARGGFSPDGTKVVQVLTSFDQKYVPRAAVWDVATGRKLAEVELPGMTQIAATLSPDGKKLVTVGVRRDDKKEGPGTFAVTGWEVGTNKKIGEFTEAAGFGSVYATAVIDGKTAVVTSPKTGPMVVDYVGGAKVRDLAGGGLRMAAAPALSPDRKTLAVPLFPPFGPNQTASVVLIDVASGKEKKKLEGISGSPSVVAFSPDGKTLVTGSFDTTALVWDLGGK